MYLTDLELVGFKSFARSTRIHCGPGITAIVGPNGSGKSNIAEAVKWVLGEQSLKQLRCTDSTDIIFSGNDALRPAPAATVKLTFNNESGVLPVAGAEVTIARRVTRSGESEYSINSDPIRLLDLQHLLAEAGIGTKSYTVISQGMVSRYVDCSPAERKELFDEATGVKSLYLKLTKAGKDLEQTQQHAQTLQRVIEELLPRLKVLQRQMDRQAKKQQLEDEYRLKQGWWLGGRYQQVTAAIEQRRGRLSSAKQQIKLCRQRREKLEATLLTRAQDTIDDRGSFRQLTEERDRLARTYEEARQRWQQYVAEYRHLQELLSKATSHQEHAERAFQLHPTITIAKQWLDPVRSCLQQGKKLLDRLRHHEVNTHDITDFEAVLLGAERTLNDTTDRTMLERLLAPAMAPLQEVARLRAIVQERQRQLEALLPVAEPSALPLQEIDRRLREILPPQPATDVAAELAAARGDEVAAERAHATAEAELKQYQHDERELEAEIRREQGSSFLEQLQAETVQLKPVTAAEVRELAARLAIIGELDPLAAKEYEQVQERYTRLTQELQDIEESHRHTAALIHLVRRQITERYLQQLSLIQAAFQRYFSELFGGGSADLLYDQNGVDMRVHPPGKRMLHLHLLSGGEKTLTALALFLSIIEVQRPPFLVLDEVDAALDQINSDRFIKALSRSSSTTQYLMVTHNRETMASSNALYGVAMDQAGVSQVYGIQLNVPLTGRGVSTTI